LCILQKRGPLLENITHDGETMTVTIDGTIVNG